MKRHRNSETETDSQVKKRSREVDFVDEEIELRDKLLDEFSSNPSSQESLNNQNNQSEVDSSSGDNDNLQLRKIIKLEGPLPNLALPDGWIALNHRSGGIIYLHRATRVCTWARPYYIGKGSVRKHDVPLAAIPCLHQKKALNTKQIQTQDHQNSQNPSVGRGSILNFLNTAGSTDHQIEQVNDTSGYRSGKEHRNYQGGIEGTGCNINEGDNRSTQDSSSISLGHACTHNKNCAVQKVNMDSNGDGNSANGEIPDGSYGNGSYGNNDIFDSGGNYGDHKLVDGDDNPGINKIVDDGDDSNYGNNEIVCGVGSNHSNNEIVDDADGNKIVDDGDNSNYGNNEIVCGVGSNHSNNEIVDDADGKTNVDNGNHGNNGIVADVNASSFNAFHPKDGLDVVNDTLRVYSENTQNAHDLPKDSPAKIHRSSPTLFESSKPDFCSKLLQSTSLKSVKNDGLCKTPCEANTFQVDVTPCSASLVTQTVTESENSNSSEDQSCTNSKNYPLKSEQMNILNGVHQNSGIHLIDAEDLSTYIGNIFEFEELSVHQEQNVIKTSQPEEQVDTILSSALECLPYCVKGKNAKENKGWVLNPGGKTPVAILHEYSQAVLKDKPVYVCSECDNGVTPFMTEIQINGITYGSGVASSKKQAKQIAAEAALEVFLPDVFHKIRDYVISREELECFDKLKIDDPQVYEVSIKSGLPSPSQVLQECLKRNQGVCSSIINFKIVPGDNQNHSFKISCGKHSAQGFCKNKKIGKQLASQAILMKLHPHISTWGSLLRIYCDRPSSIVKKYKTPDGDSLMNNIASTTETPRGQVLLERLKEEMRKIANEKHHPSETLALIDTRSISTVDI